MVGSVGKLYNFYRVFLYNFFYANSALTFDPFEIILLKELTVSI